jgi:hypothetical protein
VDIASIVTHTTSWSGGALLLVSLARLAITWVQSRERERLATIRAAERERLAAMALDGASPADRVKLLHELAAVLGSAAPSAPGATNPGVGRLSRPG